MPAPRAPQGQQRAVQRAPGPSSSGPSSALVAVTHEIDNRLGIIRASAAAGISADRLKLVALTVFTRTPALLDCEPVSVARAIVEAAQLGLEPTGLLGGAYLVPRGGKATLMVGYKGLVILAKRSGEVAKVEARVVRLRDSLDYEYGLDSYLHHKPSREPDPGPYTDAYATIYYRDGSRQFDVMSFAEIEAIRKRSSAGSSGPWVTDWPEMAKKTVLRRLLKLAPLSVEIAQKLDELDPEVEEASPAASGRQAELRQELQQALEREYGTTPSEGVYREPPPQESTVVVTTEGDGAGTPVAQAQVAAEGARPAPSPAPRAQRAAPVASAATGAPAEPVTERAPEPAPEDAPLCGVIHQGLGVGPCILPLNHEELTWHDSAGQPHPPQREHVELDGAKWTMPREAQS